MLFLRAADLHLVKTLGTRIMSRAGRSDSSLRIVS
jgi:hypothetical protein